MADVVAVPPTGVFVPSPTFLHPASSSPGLQPTVDIESQVKHSVFLAQNGIRGLVLLGSTGEAIHLNRQERYDLIAGCRKGLDNAGFPEYPIMAGVLTNGINETLEWLQDYAKAGAQWGLVLVPGYFGAAGSQANIKEWYTIIADNSPIPILMQVHPVMSICAHVNISILMSDPSYNYPGVTNNVLVTPETYTALAQHPKIVGCKMSHGNISYHVQVSQDPAIDHNKFRVYSGFGQQLGPIVFFGAAGVIDGLAAIYPKTVVRLMGLSEKRCIEPEALVEIQRLQYIVSKAEEYIGKTGVVGIKEAVFRVTGLGTLEGGRLPLKGKLAEGQWEELRALYLADVEKSESSL